MIVFVNLPLRAVKKVVLLEEMGGVIIPSVPSNCMKPRNIQKGTISN